MDNQIVKTDLGSNQSIPDLDELVENKNRAINERREWMEAYLKDIEELSEKKEAEKEARETETRRRHAEAQREAEEREKNEKEWKERNDKQRIDILKREALRRYKETGAKRRRGTSE